MNVILQGQATQRALSQAQRQLSGSHAKHGGNGRGHCVPTLPGIGRAIRNLTDWEGMFMSGHPAWTAGDGGGGAWWVVGDGAVVESGVEAAQRRARAESETRD